MSDFRLAVLVVWRAAHLHRAIACDSCVSPDYAYFVTPELIFLAAINLLTLMLGFLPISLQLRVHQ